MSRRMAWFDRTHVLIRPDEVRVVRRAGLSGKLDPSALAVASLAGAGHAGEPWRASVERLATALAQSGARGPVTAVVSDHFVRYALIPWNARLVADTERVAFAKLHFHEVYGGLADTWDISIDQQPAGQAWFACALDRGLFQALRDACTRHGARLAAVVPALAERINRHRSALKGATFCVASIEPRRMTLAFHGAEGWQSVRSRRSDGALEDDLPTALKQEAAAGHGVAGGMLYVIAEQLAEAPPFKVTGWKMVHLNEPAAQPAGQLRPERAAETGRLPRRLTPQPDPLLEGLIPRAEPLGQEEPYAAGAFPQAQPAPHPGPAAQGELTPHPGSLAQGKGGKRAPSAL
jgi:hypothetical protein